MEIKHSYALPIRDEMTGENHHRYMYETVEDHLGVAASSERAEQYSLRVDQTANCLFGVNKSVALDKVREIK
jgi:hypothetical protein